MFLWVLIHVLKWAYFLFLWLNIRCASKGQVYFWYSFIICCFLPTVVLQWTRGRWFHYWSFHLSFLNADSLGIISSLKELHVFQCLNLLFFQSSFALFPRRVPFLYLVILFFVHILPFFLKVSEDFLHNWFWSAHIRLTVVRRIFAWLLGFLDPWIYSQFCFLIFIPIFHLSFGDENDIRSLEVKLHT